MSGAGLILTPMPKAPSRALLQRKCGCAHTHASTRETPCPACRDEAVREHRDPLAIREPNSPDQAAAGVPRGGFTVGAPNDAFEQEADRIAQQVVDGARAAVAPDTSAPQLQRLPTAAAPNLAHAPANVQQVVGAPGTPLDSATRAVLEPRFGHDFSTVRVHADDAADRSARALDAQAYTVGRHIVFSRGRFAPGEEVGRRLLAHELAHVVQQSHLPGNAPAVQRKAGKGPGSCGYLEAAAATVLGGAAHMQIQARLMGRGFTDEFKIPRADKRSGLSPGCQPVGTGWGYADVARVRPIVSVSEIKPYYAARGLGQLEARHYRLRAEQSKQRLTGVGPCGKRGAGADDVAFDATAGPFSPASQFTLLNGAIKGREDFGPYDRDPTRNLLAEEVGGGAIGYWCVMNEEGKKKKKEEEERKKKEKEEKKKQKEKEKERKKKEKEEKAKEKEKPKEEKPKEEKPKEEKPKENEKPKEEGKPSGGAGNVGFGISIFSSSVGAGNAGVGISVGSNSAAAGTVGAGVSWFSDAAAAGAAGAGISSESSSAGVGVVGAGISSGSQGVAAGTAGVGTSDNVTSAAAGTAGAGTAENTQSATAGVAGKGDIKESTVAAAGSAGSGQTSGVTGASTGSPKKPIDPRDVTGKDADKVPPGQEDKDAAAGDAAKSSPTPGTAGAAAPGGTAGQTGASGLQPDAGAPGGAGPKGDAQGQPGSGTTGGPAGTSGGGPAGNAAADKPGAGGVADSSKLGVLPTFPFGATNAERDKIGEEASKVAAMLEKASPAQKLLLQQLAKKEPSGQYMVPASAWIDRLLKVTAGLSPEDIEYVKQLDWRPGNISEAELSERIRKALADRKPRSDKNPSDAGSEGQPAKADAGGDPSKDKKKEPGSKDKKADGNTGSGPKKGGGKETGDAKKGGKDESSGGAKQGKKGGTGGIADIAQPVPADRTIKVSPDVFAFRILSGMSSSSSLAAGDAVICKIAITDRNGVSFELDGVSITFLSRTDTSIVKDGVTYVETKFKIKFTNVIWSEKNNFFGSPEPHEEMDYSFGRRRVGR